MRRVEIKKIKGKASVFFERTGSVALGTIEALVPRVETYYEIDSDADPEEIAKVLRVARAGCWVRQAVATPTSFEDHVTVNGQPLNVGM